MCDLPFLSTQSFPFVHMARHHSAILFDSETWIICLRNFRWWFYFVFLHREGSQEIALTVLRIKTFISPFFPLRPRQAFHYFPSVIHPFWDKRKALEGQSGEFSPWYLDVSPIISTTFTTLLHEILQFRPHPHSSSASLLYKIGWTSYGRFSEGEGGGVGEGGEWNIHKPSEGKGM